MNISTVRQAMATALANTGVRVSAYALAQPTPPGIQILPPGVQFDRAMHRGIDEWEFIIQGFVSLNTDTGAQKQLDALCAPSGASSVKALLESDSTLGGRISDLRVTEQTPGRLAQYPAGDPLLLVEWHVQVWATP